MKSVYPALAFLFLGFFLPAETVNLVDGHIIEGTITARDANSLTIETPDGPLTVELSRVSSIGHPPSGDPSKLLGLPERESMRIPGVTAQGLVMNSSVLVHPGLSILSLAMGGTPTFILETQLSLSKFVGISTTAFLPTNDPYGRVFFMLFAGPFINFNSGHLSGFFIGAYPGVAVLTSLYDKNSFPVINLRAGYQFIGENGFTFSAYLGGIFGGPSTIPDCGVGLGYAFPNPLIKVRMEAK